MAMVQDKPAWAFEHSVNCEVTVEFAWGFLADVENWAFDSDIESVEIDGPFCFGPSRVHKQQKLRAHRVVHRGSWLRKSGD